MTWVAVFERADAFEVDEAAVVETLAASRERQPGDANDGDDAG